MLYVWCLFSFRDVMWVPQPFGLLSIIKVDNSQRRQNRRLTVEVEEMLVMADLGYVSRRHGVRGRNESAQVGSPHFIRTQGVLLGFAMRGECAGLFCKYTSRNDKQAPLRRIINHCQFLGPQTAGQLSNRTFSTQHSIFSFKMTNNYEDIVKLLSSVTDVKLNEVNSSWQSRGEKMWDIWNSVGKEGTTTLMKKLYQSQDFNSFSPYFHFKNENKQHVELKRKT